MAIDPIGQFYSKFSRYPGNNKQWWVARADADDPDTGVKAGDFMPELLDKLFYGNNRAPRGHFILDAFNKDRSGVSGVGGIAPEVTNERPTSCSFYAGRVFWGVNSTIYFSQLLTDKHKAGLCYQEADPTSEALSDLVATDGGVIPIPESSQIVKLVTHGEGVLVLATNGIWQVTGTANGFSALDISVNKVSPIGCKNPQSVVETEDSVFWWSDVGIMGMQAKSGMYGPIPGAFDRANISESTIQTFFNNIDDTIKAEVKGAYDARNNRVLWLYRDGDADSSQYNRVLVFDVSLNAFYPWKFSSLSTDTPVIKGLYVSERLTTTEDADQVVVGGVPVTVASEEVEITSQNINRYPSTVEYLAIQNGKGRFCTVDNPSFVDWEQADGTGAAYNSFIETGYELFNDAMKRKNITYLFTYLRQTETTSTPEPSTDDPSSCYMTVKWDWANSPVANKWTTPVQVYRPGRGFIPMNAGSFDTGYPIVVTKSKIRGNGKAIQFRYGTDEPHRNFDLHGWAISVTGDTVP